MTTHVTLSDFQSKVEYSRKHKSSDILLNASTDYAAILLENLFEFAREAADEIQILSGSLFPNVYDKLVPHITNALNDGCSVRVIVLCDLAHVAQTQFYKSVKGHERGQVVTLGQEAGRHNHFVVVGNSAYRLETDDSASTAIASFKDSNGIVPQLKNKFEKLWGKTNGRSHDARGGVSISA